MPGMFDYRTKVRISPTLTESRNPVNRRAARPDPRQAHGAGQGVYGDARQGPHRSGLVRQAAAGDDAVASGARQRPFPRDGAENSPHAGRTGLRRAERTRILAVDRNPETRLCLSRDPELDRTGDAADA